MATLSRAEMRAFRQFTKPHKFNATRTEIDGIWFDSKKEAAEYGKLKLLERIGKVQQLELQPAFELHAPSGEVLGKYKADFRFIDQEGRSRVVDVKGVKTPVYRLKKKMVEAEYGIRIEER